MEVYSVADNIISSLGTTSSQHYDALLNLKSGIQKINDKTLAAEPFFGAQIDSILLDDHFNRDEKFKHSRLEKMFIISISNILETMPELDKDRLLLIISSTKGNIDLLKPASGIADQRSSLSSMAKHINAFFQFKHEPVVISNACISGLSAIITARKLIKMGRYDHVLVAGGDIMSEFVISGFQCLKAISSNPCKPYDLHRDGISIGEACGTILISNNPALCKQKESFSTLCEGGQSNDANHISGPSRTGKGLKIAIEKALVKSGVAVNSIAYINAHGTGTVFNDEMESLAFSDLGFQNTPVNSLKGYFGHTLGASGIIETIISIWQMNRGLLFKSLGFTERGTSGNINVIDKHREIDKAKYIMKTASGFGGCNAALILKNGNEN